VVYGVGLGRLVTGIVGPCKITKPPSVAAKVLTRTVEPLMMMMMMTTTANSWFCIMNTIKVGAAGDKCRYYLIPLKQFKRLQMSK
jgi:hypothetical protein